MTILKRFGHRLRDLRIAHALGKLRQSGELRRILDVAPYTYLQPGSFQGDDWYHVHWRDAPGQANFLYSSLNENDVIWWILQRHRGKS